MPGVTMIVSPATAALAAASGDVWSQPLGQTEMSAANNVCGIANSRVTAKSIEPGETAGVSWLKKLVETSRLNILMETPCELISSDNYLLAANNKRFL